MKKLALALKNKARRPRDLAARYGGEEFVMLLPHTTLQRAVAIAESIRRAIADWRVPHEDSEGGIVTVSIGAATAIPGQGDAAASLVVAADAAVYRAKAAGRNRVQAA